MRYYVIIFLFVIKLHRRAKMLLIRPFFNSYGTNFIFHPSGIFSYANIEIGNDVFIGPNANLSASNSKIIFGNKIMLGPNVTMMGGDHNTSVLGKYMFDIKVKLPENDKSILIKDDVWIGAGATILKGVTVGQGAIVAAGSVVISDVPEYSIVAGVPAKVVKMRFSEEDIKKHKELLNVWD